MNPALHSHKRDDWETPDELFNALDREFGFVLDPCATESNAKCPRYFTADENGLIRHWDRLTAFVNPPYSQLAAWIDKCHTESLNGSTVVLLIPARTDTKAFHKYIWDHRLHRPRGNVELRLLPGRLKFKGADASAPFPSAIVVFHPPIDDPVHQPALPIK